MKTKNINFAERAREYEAKKRRQHATRAYLRNGICALFRRPFTALLPLSILLLAVIVWNKRDDIPLPGGNNDPVLTVVWLYAVSAAIITLAVAFIMVSFTIMGKPKRAKYIESGLALVGIVDRYGCAPVLVNSKRVKNSRVRVLTFFSRGISKERWQGEKAAIEDVLNARYLEDVRYGGRKANNSNYIVLTVAPGAGNIKRGAIYDDEL